MQDIIVSRGGRGFLDVIKSKGPTLINYIEHQCPSEKAMVGYSLSPAVRIQVTIFEAQNVPLKTLILLALSS